MTERDLLRKLDDLARRAAAVRLEQEDLVAEGRAAGVSDASMARALGKQRSNMVRDFPR